MPGCCNGAAGNPAAAGGQGYAKGFFQGAMKALQESKQGQNTQANDPVKKGQQDGYQTVKQMLSGGGQPGGGAGGPGGGGVNSGFPGGNLGGIPGLGDDSLTSKFNGPGQPGGECPNGGGCHANNGVGGSQNESFTMVLLQAGGARQPANT